MQARLPFRFAVLRREIYLMLSGFSRAVTSDKIKWRCVCILSLMSYVGWLAIIISISTLFADHAVEKGRGPLPRLSAETAFLPKAITYLSHLFPLRDDTTMLTFGRDDSKRTKEAEEQGDGKPGYDAMLLDRPFWRDIRTHLGRREFEDVERMAAFHSANPTFRRVEYGNERCEDADQQSLRGQRVIQSYVDRGLPFEMRRNSKQSSCLVSVAPLVDIPWLVFKPFSATITAGFRTDCVPPQQMVDNEPRGLGFIQNVDYLVAEHESDLFFERPLSYGELETLSEKSSALPYENTKLNIKIDISWEKWSCCSACCCSLALCGLYSNEKKCHEVDSYRTRKGLLSVYLLDFKKSPILDEHLESWTGKKRPARSSHVGMFIEEEGCAGMEQMKNCSVLAACRGQIVEEVGIQKDSLPLIGSFNHEGNSAHKSSTPIFARAPRKIRDEPRVDWDASPPEEYLSRRETPAAAPLVSGLADRRKALLSHIVAHSLNTPHRFSQRWI
ncbi:unnamed protein product [Heligmosomoides polygyrus]|uniref:Transmembrane protein n=1 Tax=Heligmosomoides polygyrus TaxID=6339 RepID=A0A3P7Z6N9_HELPZ|nr:unnamed protein product [Heligmosomoides polygyrus]